jgi:RNA 2',3'-cyclic 3'-phosphodiesterase
MKRSAPVALHGMSNGLQRLFIAAYPPAPAIDDLATLVSRLALAQPHPDGVSLRPVPPDQWHVTLAFLGDVSGEQANAVTTAMTAAAGRVAAPRLRLGGGGFFDNGRAAAIWTGLTGDIDRLQALADELRSRLRAAGVPFDARPYQPHLTLGRPGSRLTAAELSSDLASLDAYQGPAWTLGALALMRSDYPVSNDYTRIFAAPLPA